MVNKGALAGLAVIFAIGACLVAALTGRVGDLYRRPARPRSRPRRRSKVFDS
jgi:hypothetical protein